MVRPRVEAPVLPELLGAGAGRAEEQEPHGRSGLVGARKAAGAGFFCCLNSGTIASSEVLRAIGPLKTRLHVHVHVYMTL